MCFISFLAPCLIGHVRGSGLTNTNTVLDTPGKLGKMIIGMNKALGEIPVTVKLRTGVKDGRNTAHKLMPRLSTEWSAGCITVRLPLFCHFVHHDGYFWPAAWADAPATIHEASRLGLH